MANIKISELTPKGSAIGPNDLLEVSVFQGLNYVTRSIKGENIISAVGGNIHVPLKPITNQNVSLALTGANTSFSFSYSSQNLLLFPFTPAKSFVCNQISIEVTTAAPSGLARILIYSDSNGQPSSRVTQSSAFDCSTTGVKTYSFTLSLTAGTTYWLGFLCNNALITFNSTLAQNLYSFGNTGTNGITAYSLQGIGINSAPAILSGLTTSNIVNSNSPSFLIQST